MSADEWVDHSDPCVYLSPALQPDLVLYTDIIAGGQESFHQRIIKYSITDDMVDYRSDGVVSSRKAMVDE